MNVTVRFASRYSTKLRRSFPIEECNCNALLITRINAVYEVADPFNDYQRMDVAEGLRKRVGQRNEVVFTKRCNYT